MEGVSPPGTNDLRDQAKEPLHSLLRHQFPGHVDINVLFFKRPLKAENIDILDCPSFVNGAACGNASRLSGQNGRGNDAQNVPRIPFCAGGAADSQKVFVGFCKKYST